MAVTATVAGKFTLHLVKGEIDWDVDTFKVTLHTASFAPNKDTTEFYSDLTNELATAGGYTAGGQALTLTAPTYDSANDRTLVDCTPDPRWDPATFTCRYAVVRKDTGTAGTSPIVGWIDFGANQSPAGVPFIVQIDATGLLRVAAIG